MMTQTLGIQAAKPEVYISEAVHESLASAAAELQSRYAEGGDHYTVESLQKALVSWLEASIESLAEDALFHCVEGSSPHTFNRRAFEQQVNRIQPIQPIQLQEVAAA